MRKSKAPTEWRRWIGRAIAVSCLAGVVVTLSLMALWTWRQYNTSAVQLDGERATLVWEQDGVVRFGWAMDGYQHCSLSWSVSTHRVESPWGLSAASPWSARSGATGRPSWFDIFALKSVWDHEPSELVRSTVRQMLSERGSRIDSIFLGAQPRPQSGADVLVSGRSKLHWSINWQPLLNDFAIGALASSALILGLWAMVRLIYRWRMRHALNENCCLGCGYSLAGLSGGVCPECGKPFDVRSSGA